RKSMKIEDIELVEIKKIKKSHQTYEQLFKGHQTIMKKSFFPSGWTREHVMEKILEAYEDAVERRTYLEEGKTKSNIIGLTKEGIVIYITLDMSLESGNTLITAYPLFTEEYQNDSK
ncbi:EndoU domain-containing protein, partial [Candidatus Babeliales bacterium]|nr:EndoU domain-containing protein [Candidatus Babeliales bacterium]